MRKRDKILLILSLFATVAISSAITTVLIIPRTIEAYGNDLEWRVDDLESKVNRLKKNILVLESRVSDLEY